MSDSYAGLFPYKTEGAVLQSWKALVGEEVGSQVALGQKLRVYQFLFLSGLT